MAALNICWLLCLLLVPSTVHTSRILLIPFYHYSHVNMFGVAGSALTRAGHDVTMMVSHKFSKMPQKFNLHSINYEIINETHMENELATLADKTGLQRLYYAFRIFPKMTRGICDDTLGDEEVMAAVRKGQFDLVIIDGSPVMNCFFVIPYKFDISYITLTFLVDPWSAGLPSSVAVEPVMIIPSTNQQSFLQRLSVAAYNIFAYTMPHTATSSHHYVEKYAPEKPPTSTLDIYRHSDMFLINQEVLCMDYPRISAPNYQFIGGSSAKPAKPLPTELEDFVNGATHGLIIVSFGSHESWQSMWRTLKPKMIYVFSRLQQRAILLYSLDDNTGDFPPNVKAMKWLPQNDLLGHANTKLFVTHGGNNGQLEAVYHGVPMLVLPVMGDQQYNAIRVAHHGYGRMLNDYKETTEENLLEEMKAVLLNESYSDNVKKCSNIIKSQPSTQELILHWVNHVLTFGGSHLRPPSVDIPLYQVLMVDLILFVFITVFILVVVSIMCCRCIVRRICCREKAKEKRA